MAQKKYKAFIFDLNGTMIDDMDYHIKAWQGIFHSLGAHYTWEQTKAECYGKNSEVLERVFPGRFSDEEKNKMSIEKETQYQREFRPFLKLIPGLEEVLATAKERGIKMGIGSAAILFNVDFVIDGLHIRHYFDSIVSADDVVESKPDPETFLNGAAQLKVDPADCLVFEDSPKGTEAAKRAGMDSVVITTMHTIEEFDLSNVIGYIKDYNNFFEFLNREPVL
jgi:beta-phosphoglucomutase family hydrolase